VQRKGWSVRRADDFPPPSAGGNRALCCTTTCCAVFIGMGVGIVAGGVTGLVTGIRAVKRRSREGLPAAGVLPAAYFAGLASSLFVLPLDAVIGWWSLLLPLVVTLGTWGLTRVNPRASNALAVLSRVLIHIAIWAAIGALVLGGVGLAIDWISGTFR
jgi:hypothetical protein